MKKSIVLATLFASFATAPAFAANDGLGEFTCTSKSMRGGLGDEVVDARMVLDLAKADDGNVVLEKLVGHVVVAREANEAPAANYYSVFSLTKLAQNTSYRPRVYTDSIQFKNVDTSLSSNVDGGGMWGQLVVAKDRTGDSFDAHYIFQSGDHLGGTIDLKCGSRW